MRSCLSIGHLDGPVARWHHGTMFRRRSDPPPMSRMEWNALLAMIMRMDWKLDQIMEELEVDHGEEEN